MSLAPPLRDTRPFRRRPRRRAGARVPDRRFEAGEERAFVPDGGLVVAVVVLLGLGLVAIESATATRAPEAGLSPYTLGQLGGAAAGALLALAAMHVPLRLLVLAAPGLYLAGVVLLALVLATAPPVNGAQRWLPLPGGLVFQPAELAKFATVLLTAVYLARDHRMRAGPVRSAALTGCLAAVPAGLLVAQPDLGNAVLVPLLVGGLLFAAGMPLRVFGLGGTALGALVAWHVVTHPYAMARLRGFLDPFAVARGEGFQLVQSFVAFGRGSLTGVGIGMGRQPIEWLPEAHTDFILAVVAEELGVLGALAVLGAFAAITLAGFRIARRARDPLARLVATGMTLLLAVPGLVNGAVVTGLLPTKGLALPFMSYGRSGLLISFLAAGILAGIGRREAAPSPPPVRGAVRRRRLP